MLELKKRYQAEPERMLGTYIGVPEAQQNHGS